MNTSVRVIDQRLIVRVPLPPKHRGGRKFVVVAGGIASTGRRVVVDNTLVKALGWAHRWKAMLESGEYAERRPPPRATAG
jgi:hypothetical protein